MSNVKQINKKVTGGSSNKSLTTSNKKKVIKDNIGNTNIDKPQQLITKTNRNVIKMKGKNLNAPSTSVEEKRNVIGRRSNQSIININKNNKAKENVRRLNKERTLTRILSPSEVKILTNKITTDTNEYEDDFESETSGDNDDASIQTDSSDSNCFIEKDNEQEEDCKQSYYDDRKLDSGHYDMKQKQLLVDEIKATIAKENVVVVVGNESSFDEGFHEDVSSIQKCVKKKKKKNRGQHLIDMIRLNCVEFSLLDLSAVPYEKFMKYYGQNGTLQISTETDPFQNTIETQTDDLKSMAHIETQFPDTTHYRNGNMSLLGQRMFYTLHFLHNLNAANKLNDETECDEERNDSYLLNVVDIWSDCVPFFLNDSKCLTMFFSNNELLLTVHASNVQNYQSAALQLLSRAMVCLWQWSTLPLDRPRHILVASGGNNIVKVCCGQFVIDYFIFAAIDDGTVNVWDLRNNDTVRLIYDERTDETFPMRSPIYTMDATAQTMSNLTNIQLLNSKLYTLTESGILIIWNIIIINRQLTILQQNRIIRLEALYSKLNELHCFDLQLVVNNNNNYYYYVLSNYGILRCTNERMENKNNNNSGGIILCDIFVTCMDIQTSSRGNFLLLCGYKDGRVALYAHDKIVAVGNNKPLMVFFNNNSCGVKNVRWSGCRPCVFYVLDQRNNFTIWNIAASDLEPIHSDLTLVPPPPTQLDIDHMFFTHHHHHQMQHNCLMIIATKNGQIYVHQIKKHLCCQTSAQYENELKILSNYINRL